MLHRTETLLALASYETMVASRAYGVEGVETLRRRMHPLPVMAMFAAVTSAAALFVPGEGRGLATEAPMRVNEPSR
jgi:hypothetical protein